MDSKFKNKLSDFLPNEEFPTKPTLLLAGNNSANLRAIRDALIAANFDVKHIGTFAQAEDLWLEHHHQAVLLDVDHYGSVPPALLTAIQIKTHDSRQFLAYLADPILRSSGLAGDAFLTRNTRDLPEALLRCFVTEFASETVAPPRITWLCMGE